LLNHLEQHLRGGETLENFKPKTIMSDTSLLGGLNCTLFFWDSHKQPNEYVKKLVRKFNKTKGGVDKYLSKYWKNLELCDNAFNNIHRQNWDRMISSKGNDMAVDTIAPLFTSGERGMSQTAAVRTGYGFGSAMTMYRTNGIMTRDFLDRLVDIRALWHQTHLMYSFEKGEKSLEYLYSELNVFIPCSKPDCPQLMQYLFG
jgi:hypothetical protein